MSKRLPECLRVLSLLLVVWVAPSMLMALEPHRRVTSLQEPIAGWLPGYRLATAGDFLPAIRRQAEADAHLLETELLVDFDQDGRPDHVLLLVNEKKNLQAIYAFLDDGHGSYRKILLSASPLGVGKLRGVSRPIAVKKPRSKGESQRDYFEEGKPETERKRLRKEYVAAPAIESWIQYPRSDDSTPINPDDVGDLSYCSECYRLLNGKVQTSSVCD